MAERNSSKESVNLSRSAADSVNHDDKSDEEQPSTSKSEDNSQAASEMASIKSAAVVKYSTVEAPATYTRLRCNTDLNLPPSNWLSSSTETYGLQPSLFHRSGFSSFRMAHMFPDCVGEVDVVSDAENIKKLLKIPYSHGPVSMMIHRIENTLLIDEFDVHKYLLREAESQWEWFKKFFIEHVLQSVNVKDKLIHTSSKSRNALQQKSLVSKFLYHSLVVADSNEQKVEKPEDEPENADPSVPIPLPYKSSDPPLPEPTLEQELPDAASDHKFARNVVWTFEDIQMLLGTDMPIFGGGTHPCISLRLRDMTKPINVLTGMDYWLDNLMCNVPEVVMCYHLNGIVQKYELIKTEDLPHLENSKFSPKVIRDIAQNILSFLKANATKAGHTYWLFKGKDDDVVKLYDLTSLCTDVLDDKGQTPFTVPVAMLLYRVARNMKNCSDGSRQAGTIRMLLKNCVALLSSKKYPQIVTSAHYMLADLYIPANINPASPDLTSDEEVHTEERKEPINESKFEDLAIKSLSLSNIGELQLEEGDFMPPPPALGSDVESRCVEGIGHVLQGLQALQFLSEPPEVKVTVNEEEPAMAKPFQTIPMPFHPSEERKDAKRKNRKKKKETKPPETEAKSLLCKPQIDAVPTWRPTPSKITGSWNTHLKTLLYEKACLIYATLLEKSYSEEKFGLALHYIRMVLRTRQIFKQLRSETSDDGVESYLLGRAGDALFMLVQNSSKLNLYNKDYDRETEFDVGIMEELKKEGFTDDDTNFPPVLESLEDLLACSSRFYQAALACQSKATDPENLQRRLGNIENELGVYYMNQAAAKYQEESTKSGDGDSKSTKFKELFAESLKHLEAGIKAFETVKDKANLALLHSNTGRLMRLRAHFHSPGKGDRTELAGPERHFYTKAVASYQKALQVLSERKFNPVIWDSINWELSTALYTMATLLQDFPSGVARQEEAERELSEMLQKALKYCDVDTPAMRQPLYQFRSAMIHHRLASLYHESYRSSTEEETRKRKTLQLCKLYYEKSAKLLTLLEHPAEYLRVQLERVALAEYQAENSNTSYSKQKHFESALGLLLEAKNILKIVSDRDSGSETEKTDQEKETDKNGRESKVKDLKTDDNDGEGENKSELENEMNLLVLFEQRLQFVLLSLTKLSMNKTEGKKEPYNVGERYKNLYAGILRAKVNKNNPVELAASLYTMVCDISVSINSLPSST